MYELQTTNFNTSLEFFFIKKEDSDEYFSVENKNKELIFDSSTLDSDRKEIIQWIKEMNFSFKIKKIVRDKFITYSLLFHTEEDRMLFLLTWCV